MKKLICLFLIILILSFSVVSSFASNDGIMTLATSTRWTPEQMLENGAVCYKHDSVYDNFYNIKTYLDYLNTPESHVCSTFNNKWCYLLDNYKLFLSKYSELKSSYNYYVVVGPGNYPVYQMVLSSVPLYYNGSYYLTDSTLDADVFYFSMKFGFDGNSVIYPSNNSEFVNSDSYSFKTDFINLLLSNVDIYDKDGNLVNEKNVFEEELPPEEETGSDVTLGGISGAINNAFNKFGEFITNIFSSIIESITGFFSKFTDFFDFLERIYIAYNPGIAFGKFINFFIEFLSYARSGFDVITVFVQSIPTPFSYFIYVPLLLLIWFSVFRRLL